MNCTTTHHMGCACHEERHAEEVASLTRELSATRAEVADYIERIEAQAAEIARLRERVVISDARLECAHDDNDRLRRERDEARDEVERAEPRRQRDARDIADADGEIVRLRAGLEVAEREAAALRDAAGEWVAADRALAKVHPAKRAGSDEVLRFIAAERALRAVGGAR